MSGQAGFNAPGFSHVPASVRRALPRLSGSAAKLAIALCGYADREGRCYPSVRTLMRDAGIMDTRTFNRARDELATCCGLGWGRARHKSLDYWWGACVEPFHTEDTPADAPAACGTDPPSVCGTTPPAMCGTVPHGSAQETPHANDPMSSSIADAAASLRSYFPKQESFRIVREYGPEKIKATLELLAVRNAAGEIKNPAGFLKEALRGGWADGPDAAAEIRWAALCGFVKSNPGLQVNMQHGPARLALHANGRIIAMPLLQGDARALDSAEAESILAPLMEQAERRKASAGGASGAAPQRAQEGEAGFSS